MKKTILLAILLILIIWASSLYEPKDNCSHLEGRMYEECHLLEVKGR